MAFVDISGFTAMAERLAPMGRMGAEEVTDVMNATFSRLLGIAYENGGGLGLYAPEQGEEHPEIEIFDDEDE